MTNVAGKNFRENKSADFYVQFVLENRFVYEIIWKNIVQPDRPLMTIRRMRIEC